MRLNSSKYKAKRTTVDGVTFHSQKEARRYQELKLLQKAGEIQDLTLQPSFDLVVGLDIGMDDALLKKIGTYVADFQYTDRMQPGCPLVVEDVKGFKTPLYRWKKKHVEAQYGIQIRET